MVSLKRTCLAMALIGAALAASTLPVVGLQTWRDWLAVGKEASDLYSHDESWIFLSRDLLGIPRRYLLDFRPEAPTREPYPLAAGLIGWGMLIGVLEATVRLAVQRRREARAASGPAAAFLLLGAWMSCYHFMYYDVLLAALPLVLLLADFKPYLQRRYVAVLLPSAESLGAGLDHYCEPRLPGELPPSAPLLRTGHRNIWLLNGVAPTLKVG